MQVLLVEDEQTIAVTLSDDLREAGHDVVHVADGKAALDLLGQRVFDVVITDVRLPGADGLQVLAASKRARPDTEVLMMTGYATVEEAVRSFQRDQGLVVDGVIGIKTAHRISEVFHRQYVARKGKRKRTARVALRETLAERKHGKQNPHPNKETQ